METKSLLAGILFGVIGLIVVFVIAVAIGCAINGITFIEQIIAWFAPSFELIKKVPEIIEP